MGTKYLPTHKDLKATQRFQQRQSSHPKFKNPTGKSPAKKSGKR